MSRWEGEWQRHRRLGSCLVAVVLLGCGSASGADGGADGGEAGRADATEREPPLADVRVLARSLCDGSPELRLMVSVVTGPSRVSPANRVLRENGAYIMIGGDCRYFVHSQEEPWRDVRSGVLDFDELVEFLEDVRYARWSQLEGVYPGFVFDAASTVFLDRQRRVVCAADCGRSGYEQDVVPEDVAAMRDAVLPWNERLWSEGTSVEGPVRGTISVTEVSDNYPAVAWPASVPLEDVVVPVEELHTLTYGDGTLFAGADAEALRQLRRDHMETALFRHSGIRWITIIDDAEVRYELTLRDTTPFEDERGLVPLLHEG